MKTARDYQIASAKACDTIYKWCPGWMQCQRHGNERKIRSPLRDDKNIGSFSINEDTGEWYDFSTNEGGDALSLYARIKGIRNGEAYAEIMGVDYDPADDFDLDPDIRAANVASLANDELKAEYLRITEKKKKNAFAIPTEDELERKGDEIWAGMVEYRQLQVAEILKTDKTEKAGPPPEGFMPPRGLIHDIAMHILATSITPQPLMAMAAATCLVSVLCGRKYRTWTNARSNIYMVALAGSGSGKEHPRQIIKEIISRCGLDDHLGGSRIASGPGLFSAMLKNPVKIFLLDEFGLTLQAINSRTAAGYQREIAQTLMELYSSASSEMKSAEYADQKLRPVETIKNPCTVLYATSTHGQFYDAIRSDHAASGQIARLMIINTPPGIPEDSEYFSISPVPQEIIEGVKALYQARSSTFTQALPGDISPEPYTVPVADDVRLAWKALRNDMKRQSSDEASASVYSRVAENAVKLALVYACSINPENPIMDQESFLWGRDLALWSANTLMEQYNRYSFDTETEKYSKQIEEFVRNANGEGVTASVMDQRLGRKFKDFEWESHKKQLFRAGILVTVTDIKSAKPGAKKVRIIHKDHFDEKKHAIVI